MKVKLSDGAFVSERAHQAHAGLDLRAVQLLRQS